MTPKDACVPISIPRCVNIPQNVTNGKRDFVNVRLLYVMWVGPVQSHSSLKEGIRKISSRKREKSQKWRKGSGRNEREMEGEGEILKMLYC